MTGLPKFRFAPGADQVPYEDVTSDQIRERLAAFLASPGVTVGVDGVVTWVYTAPECTCRRLPRQFHEPGCEYGGPDVHIALGHEIGQSEP